MSFMLEADPFEAAQHKYGEADLHWKPVVRSGRGHECTVDGCNYSQALADPRPDGKVVELEWCYFHGKRKVGLL